MKGTGARIDHRRLMAAVLDRAVRDVIETHDLPPPIVPILEKQDRGENARNLRVFILALEVRSWFAPARVGLFSFLGICDVLNKDPQAVLKRVAPFVPIRSEHQWREYEAGTAGNGKAA